MKWEDYQKSDWQRYEKRQKTDIECPECGALLWRRTDIVLTTYPPKSQYECDAL